MADPVLQGGAALLTGEIKSCGLKLKTLAAAAFEKTQSTSKLSLGTPISKT